MLVKIIILFLTSGAVVAQLNGEFWWLNDKLAKYISASPPTFENLSEFDTDESAKIVFRDDDVYGNNNGKVEGKSDQDRVNNGKLQFDLKYQDKSELVWPADENHAVANGTEYDIPKYEHLDKNRNKTSSHSGDVLEFKFPENDNLIWKDTTNTTKILVQTTTERTIKKPNNVIIINDKVPFKVLKDKKLESESICTFLKKSECNRKGGVVYIKQERGTKKIFFESQLICCILPISIKDTSNVQFTVTSHKIPKRQKRSSNKDEDASPALKQRNALLQRKFSPQPHKIKTSSTSNTKITHKIVNSDEDYVDPYVNIKNSNFKKTNLQNTGFQNANTNNRYDNEDYIEDYVVELPQPGLVGLYSDHDNKPNYWSFGNGNTNTGSLYGGTIESEEDAPSFGYGATVDPRLENRVSKVTPNPPRHIIMRPAKLTTIGFASSEEFTYDTESQTINYQSNPDFQVMNGFKLLNLFRNKSRIYKNFKKTTTEKVPNGDSKESVLIGSSFETEYEEIFDADKHVNKDCGKSVKDPFRDVDHDKKTGDSVEGSHPWLALVVLTRKRQTILCYASLVHTRAAVTTADCVHGRSCPGEITLIAGAWKLNEEAREGWQSRMASVFLHNDYKPGDLANNLAVLHWKRPLRLSINVQPACLNDPHVGDDCIFVGWGGYDQAIRPRSRWQRASILTPRACNERLAAVKQETLPEDAFCAGVQSRGTVTGIGGPLTCAIGNRYAIVGVAIWRDTVVVLAPVRDWTLHALTSLL